VPHAVPREHSVATFEGTRVLQHRLGGLHAVVARPELVVSDPERQFRDLPRPRVYFDAEEVGRGDLLVAQFVGACERREFLHRLVLDVLEHVHRDVQEVARAARRVEHAQRPFPRQEIAEVLLGGGAILRLPCLAQADHHSLYVRPARPHGLLDRRRRGAR
jgi:hypothetical protein